MAEDMAFKTARLARRAEIAHCIVMQLVFGWIPWLAYIVMWRSPRLQRLVARFNGGWTYAEGQPRDKIAPNGKFIGTFWARDIMLRPTLVEGDKTQLPTGCDIHHFDFTVTVDELASLGKLLRENRSATAL